MPHRPGHPCRWQGCTAIVRAGVPYCEAHQREVYRRQDAQRGNAGDRGYGARWRRLRMMFLAEHPLCCDPFGVHGEVPVLATDVDHIVPRAAGGSDEESNLQALCHSCHSRKTVSVDESLGGGIKSLGSSRP